MTCSPMQSIVRALGLEHPCMQDPLNASQPPLQLDEHSREQSVEYLLESQPKCLIIYQLYPLTCLYY